MNSRSMSYVVLRVTVFNYKEFSKDPKSFDLHEYSWMGRLRLGLDTPLVHDTDAV